MRKSAILLNFLCDARLTVYEYVELSKIARKIIYLAYENDFFRLVGDWQQTQN